MINVINFTIQGTSLVSWAPYISFKILRERTFARTFCQCKLGNVRRPYALAELDLCEFGSLSASVVAAEDIA
jgi:hypothetical protein